MLPLASSLASYGVNLINEHSAGGIVASLGEEGGKREGEEKEGGGEGGRGRKPEGEREEREAKEEEGRRRGKGEEARANCSTITEETKFALTNSPSL